MFSCNSRYAFYKALLYISILDVFGYLRPVAMDPCPLCRTSSVEIITEPILTIYNMYEEEGNRNCKYEKPNSNILNIFQTLARLDRIIHGD